jgi:hypothetical protein
MELTTMQLYWIIKLDTFLDITGFLSFLLGLLAFTCIIGLFSCSIIQDFKEFLSIWKKFSKYSIPLFIIFLSVSVFLPTTKQMAALIVLPKIINNEKVQEIPQKLLDLGIEWLDELKPTKK